MVIHLKLSGNKGQQGVMCDIFRAFVSLLLLFTFLAAAGCASYLGPIARDHTVGLISRPITAPVELAWRVGTLSTNATDRLYIKYIKFPLLGNGPIPPISSYREEMASSVMAKWLKRKAGPPRPADLKLLKGGKEFFPQLKKAILNADQRINIQVFIFDNDDVGVRFADLLKKKSKEIPIRVLVDGTGSRRAWAVSAPSAGKTSKPQVGNILDYLEEDSEVQVRQWNNLWLTSNHTKQFIIDGSTAYVGGMNIGREYRYDWRDMMVEVRGEVVEVLEGQFVEDWRHSRILADFRFWEQRENLKKGSAKNGDAPCYVVRTSPFIHHIYRAHLKAVRKAHSHIYVENPYLWNDRFIYELCHARRRGVDVRVTVPLEPNIPIAERANRVALNTLLHHGVRVFLYPGMTHVKAAVFDGWASFGSANFDDLSMHKNAELNIFTDDPEFVREIEERLLVEGQDRSKEILEPLPLSIWDGLAEQIADLL